ncbi:MAG: hypothetical protein N2035_06820, partial [Chthoniobacterales bacterium]|nr:hypothetical protein [Chthoniobacterales bacterium]
EWELRMRFTRCFSPETGLVGRVERKIGEFILRSRESPAGSLSALKRWCSVERAKWYGLR